VSTPTAVALPVILKTSQPAATVCIQEPTPETIRAAKARRKFA